MKRNRRLALKLLVMLTAGVVTLAGLEGAARTYLWLRPPVGHIDRWEYRVARPPAYQSADYFSKAFLEESMASYRGSLELQGADFMVAGDFSGTLIHVADGRRRTDFQPPAPKNRVLLFGGSTAFCAETPDSETIASRLQWLLNHSDGPPLAVENYGNPSMYARQQLARLETLSLQPGDVVLFYDGVNDVIHPVYNGNPRGWHPGDARDGGVRKLNAVQRWMHQAFIRYGDSSGLVRLLFNAQQRALPHAIADDATLLGYTELAESGYRAALARAQAVSEKSGATFHHFVQPHIFSLTNPSSHERWLIENDLTRLRGLDRAFAVAYPRLQRAAAEACGQANHDLADILSNRGANGEVYLDFCHVNHVANRIIARHIFELAFPSRARTLHEPVASAATAGPR